MVNNFLLIGLFLFPLDLIADTAINQTTVESAQDSTIESTSTNYSAKVWNISTDDWVRYEQIMQSRGKYLWKDLDPITILGLNARSDRERNRYAELLAKQEFNNAQKVILLDRAYNQAFLKLYGQLPVVDTSQLTISRAKASLLTVPRAQVKGEFGDRYIAFVNTQCRACDELIQQALSSLQLGVSVDIHFKNDSRQAITQWAAKQRITPQSVEIGTVTLNPDSELYDQFGQPAEPSLFYFHKASNQVSEVK